MCSHLELKASSLPVYTSSATLWHWSYNLPLFRSLLESISRSPKPSTEHIKMHSQAWLLPLLLRNHPTLQGIDFLPVERSLQEHTFCFHMQVFHWFLLAGVKQSPTTRGRDQGSEMRATFPKYLFGCHTGAVPSLLPLFLPWPPAQWSC